MATTVPMLAPDGSSGDIPFDKMDAAKAAGFKVAVQMQSPDGKSGYVPAENTHDAVSQGFKMMPMNVPDAAKASYWDALTNPVGSGGRDQGVIGGALQVGGQAIKTMAQPFMHPLDMLKGIAQTAAAVGTGNPVAVGQAVAAPIAQQYMQDKAQGGNALAFENLGGQALGTVEGGRALGVGAKAAGSAVGDTASAAKASLYPTSQSLAPQVSTARNLARALVVEPAAAPNFIKAATDEAGTIVGYAKDNNLPINSKVDFANAAKGAAKTVQDHYDSLLKPNADTVTAVPASYRGTRVGEGPNATLDAINDRIDAISSELKPNFRKATAAQTSTANTSDADLIAEKQALTNVLHTKLAAATGLDPADIAAVRQQAGKLRTIADEANLSANRDTAAAGKQAMGATTSAVGTKVGMIDRALQAAQGGPEIIGNRQVLAALRNVEPQSINLPAPKTPAPSLPPMSRMDQLLQDAKMKFEMQKIDRLLGPAQRNP